MRIADDVKARLARFVPTPIDADLSALSPGERAVLGHLARAAARLDPIFLRQASEDNPALREALEADPSPLARDALAYFDLSAGPWDRLDEQPFVGDAPRPDGAGFYPKDLGKEALEAWIAAHPADAEAMRGLHTVVRRKDGGLIAVPYSVAYREWLEPCAEDLLKAADAAEDESLAKYLRAVAKALGTDDYYESDLAWMDMESRVEVTLGPYETYEDRLFGYKAAFEAMLTVTDEAESKKLAGFKAELPAMEQNLPIPDEHKNPNRGTASPIRVVDLVLATGDARKGVQTIAFNLPNDERVREAKGCKKVMLRNVMRAKFERILRPIAERVLAPAELSNLSADAFFYHTLLHEMSHGLGPGRIRVGGRETEVRLALEEFYTAIEEAKADVMGIDNVLYLMDRGLLPAEGRASLFSTVLAGFFRATRFGVAEAHGAGTALQFNWLLEKGIVREGEDGKFTIDHAAAPAAIRELLHEVLMVQALGDREGARAMLSRYGVMSPSLSRALGRLSDIPVDIKPSYPAAEALLAP
jgi:hypothetical protein